MSNKIEKYDKNGNLIYKKFSNGWEFWDTYDENNNRIYSKIHSGDEYWYKYGNSGGQTRITEKEYKEIEFRAKEKEYNSRIKCSRFELMEI